MTRLTTIFLTATALVTVLSLPEISMADQITAMYEQDFESWSEHSFKGHTSYFFERTTSLPYVKASCTDTASALYQESTVDLSKTPVLHWSWKIEGVHPQLNEREKSGDDYPARVYVVYAPSSLMPWRTLAIDYVWSNNQKVGSVWPNAFTKNAVMVALQSGNPAPGNAWRQEVRNVRDDFKAFFGIDLDSINGVAIMTDCDNVGLPMVGYYKNLRFSQD